MSRQAVNVIGRARIQAVLRLLPVLLAVSAIAGCSYSPAAKKQRYIERGDEYFKNQRYGDAVIEYKNAVRVDPSDGDANYKLGLAVLQQGLWSPAAESFSRALQFTPDNLDARLRLGDILVAAGQFDDARTQAEEVLKRDPQNASAYLLLGQISLQQKKYDEAEQRFDQARQFAPHDPLPYGNLAVAQMFNAKFDLAEKNFQHAVETSPRDPQYAINWANFYRSRRNPDRAEQVLRQSMAANPNSIDLPLAVADLYVFQGRIEDAKRLLAQIEADSQHFTDSQRRVADFYLQHDDASSALDIYLPLAKQHSSDESLAEAVIRCYLQLGQWSNAQQWIDKHGQASDAATFDLLRAQANIEAYRLREAISSLQSLIQKDPGNATAHLYLSQAELQQGNIEAAKAALADILRLQPGFAPALIGLGNISLQEGDGDGAFRDADQVIAQSYWSVDAHLLAGNAEVLRNDLPAALKEFQSAADLNSSSPIPQERLGRVLSAMGKYPDAEKAYENALSNRPGYALALSGLAETFISEGQPDRARARIDQQIARESGLYQLRLIKGQFCMNRGDSACSEQSFNDAVQLDSYDASAYVSLANLYASENRTDDVAHQYELALQKFPEFLPIYVQLGHAYEKQGDFNKAKGAYHDALQADPDFVPALNDLAWLECEHGGALNEALELAQQAKKLRPNDPHVNDTLGWIYHKQGLDGLAAQLLETAVAKDSKNPGFRFHLGLVYLSLGKQEEGRTTLQAALRFGLDPDQTKVAREALQKSGS